MSIGASCRLYRTCKICEETKYLLDFPATGGAKKRFSSRRSYCHECRPRRHEKILSSAWYDFDPSLLSGPVIKVKGKTTKQKWFFYELPLGTARRLVREGAARIVHETLIHRLYNRDELRLLVMEKDKYRCFYCGEDGETIDHVVPRSKGGLTTPQNCVWACMDCNNRKGSLSKETFLQRITSQ